MDNFSYTCQKNINKSKTFFFVLLLFISDPNDLFAQWESANGPYEATLFNISFDAQNSSIIYTAGEGVFRTSNSGETWVSIEPDTSFSSTLEPVIKADPLNAGIVYFGGHGALFKSTDYGNNWGVIGFKFESVNSIEIDQTNTNVIYIGLKHTSTDAIWKSTDGGNTWQKKTNGIPETNFFQQCRSIKINPLNHNSIIAAVYYVGIFKSIDGGNNWTQLSTMDAYRLEVAPWDTTLVFAAGTLNMMKSTDAGTTWEQLLNVEARCIEINNITKEIFAGINESTDEGNTWTSLNNPEIPPSFSLAMNVADIKIDPIDKNVLYLATGAGIYKSFNKGINWKQSFDGLNKFYTYNIKISRSDPSVIYAAGREGVHKSTDGGKSWKYIWGNAAEYYIAIDPTNSDIVYVGQVPLAMEYWLWRTTDGGKNWEKKLTSLTRFEFIEFDPKNSNILYTLYTDFSKSVLCKSIDRGETWSLINTTAPPKSILISEENSEVIYIGSMNGVYQTSNGGLNWNYLGFSSNDFRIFLSFAPQDEEIIYASVYGQGVFKTTDNGLNWEEKNVGLTSKNISVFISNPKKCSQYYVGTIDSGIYVSDDEGEKWCRLYPEHPSLLIDAFFLDTTGTGRILVAGRDAPGIYILKLDLTDIENSSLNNTLNNFILFQNYPNPFNPTTTIHYELPQSGKVTLKLFDILGNEVKTLVNEQKEMGKYKVQLNASSLASGIYIYRLWINSFVAVKKMLLLK